MVREGRTKMSFPPQPDSIDHLICPMAIRVLKGGLGGHRVWESGCKTLSCKKRSYAVAGQEDLLGVDHSPSLFRTRKTADLSVGYLQLD